MDTIDILKTNDVKYGGIFHCCPFNRELVKEGLKFLHNILTPYEFEVTILADRGFKSIDLFKFIDETLKWKYCIRCTKDMRISIAGKRKIKKLDDITSRKGFTKYF